MTAQGASIVALHEQRQGTVYTASGIASGGKRYWPKVLRKVPVLPITFLGGGRGGVTGDGGVGGGSDSVGGGVTCGTGCGAGSRLIGIAGGGVSGKCGGARLAHRYLTTHPGTPCFDCIPRTVVSRILLLKVWEHMLGAVCRPEHQRPVVPLIEPQFSSSFLRLTVVLRYTL